MIKITAGGFEKPYYNGSKYAASISEEWERLNKKVREIEEILKLSKKEEKDITSIRKRLIRAVAERRMTLDFFLEKQSKKQIRSLKNLYFDP